MSKYKLPKRRIEGKTINTISSAYHQLQNTIPKKEKKKKKIREQQTRTEHISSIDWNRTTIHIRLAEKLYTKNQCLYLIKA